MNIGHGKSSSVGYSISLTTLTVNVDFTLEPNRNGGAKAPDFRAVHGLREIGYAYKETSESGVEYLSLKLDDPSFPYPVYCSLFLQSKTDELNLVWNRPKKKA